MLPTFLVIGAMKGGTTSLCAYLAEHPEVYISEEKELHFFIDAGNWARGRTWYEAQFASAGDAVARGEGSTTYALWPNQDGVPERVVGMIPEIRIVYVVREPLSRVVSHYAHDWAMGDERRSITDALTEDSAFVNGSRYTTQLARWLEHIPRSNLHVTTSEALRSDRAATVGRIQEFIGVDPSFVAPNLDTESHLTAEKRRAVRPAFRRLWANPAYRSAAKIAGPRVKQLAHRVTRSGFDPGNLELADATAEYLREILRPEVAGLRNFLGADFTGWGLLDPPT